MGLNQYKIRDNLTKKTMESIMNHPLIDVNTDIEKSYKKYKKNMKCFFSQTLTPPRCDKEADYIFHGKSYCTEHCELRAREYNEELKRLNKQITSNNY